MEMRMQNAWVQISVQLLNKFMNFLPVKWDNNRVFFRDLYEN